MMSDIDPNSMDNGNSFDANRNSIVERTGRSRILVVDDDPDVLFTLSTVLRDAGYVVDPYESPNMALRQYKPRAYDLLVLDVKMSEFNGFELYKNIKAKDEKAKVCFLTAGETYFSEFMRLFPELDEKNYILKPVENQELLERAARIIGSNEDR